MSKYALPEWWRFQFDLWSNVITVCQTLLYARIYLKYYWNVHLLKKIENAVRTTKKQEKKMSRIGHQSKPESGKIGDVSECPILKRPSDSPISTYSLLHRFRFSFPPITGRVCPLAVRRFMAVVTAGPTIKTALSRPTAEICRHKVTYFPIIKIINHHKNNGNTMLQ